VRRLVRPENPAAAPNDAGSCSLPPSSRRPRSALPCRRVTQKKPRDSAGRSSNKMKWRCHRTRRGGEKRGGGYHMAGGWGRRGGRIEVLRLRQAAVGWDPPWPRGLRRRWRPDPDDGGVGESELGAAEVGCPAPAGGGGRWIPIWWGAKMAWGAMGWERGIC
jgi:hypothetical protein